MAPTIRFGSELAVGILPLRARHGASVPVEIDDTETAALLRQRELEVYLTSHFTERRGDELFADRAFQEKREPRLLPGN